MAPSEEGTSYLLVGILILLLLICLAGSVNRVKSNERRFHPNQQDLGGSDSRLFIL